VKRKKCSDCGKVRLLKNFHRDNSRKDKHHPYCKKCVHIRNEKFRKSPRGRACAKRKYVKYLYGLSSEKYEQMVKKQKGKCAICGKAETRKLNGSVVRLSVDHDHKTGKVRELLCNHCNAMLGFVNDDVELLKKVIYYLEKNRGGE
jgi:hypothetical protein